MDTKGECYKDKWDVTKSFEYGKFYDAAEYIQEVLKAHWAVPVITREERLAMREAAKEKSISKLVDTDNILETK